MIKSAIAEQNEKNPLFTQIQTLIANRAEYGKQVIVTLSGQLTLEYGKGWSEKQLRHCMRLSEAFPDQTILSAVQRELSWTHIKMIMSIDDEFKRSFVTVSPYGGAGGEAPEKKKTSFLGFAEKRKRFQRAAPFGSRERLRLGAR